jgi:hypothetical protein
MSFTGEGMNPRLIHKVTIHNDNWHLAEAWCEHSLGEFNATWYKLGLDPMEMMMRPIGTKTQSVWYFLNERDAVMFKLKWS